MTSKSVFIDVLIKKEIPVSNKTHTRTFRMRGENMSRIETFVASVLHFQSLCWRSPKERFWRRCKILLMPLNKFPHLRLVAQLLCGFGTPMQSGVDVMASKME
jgi:hypothetical protein